MTDVQPEHVVLRGTDDSIVTLQEFNERLAELRALLAEMELSPEAARAELAAAFAGITFRDRAGATWRHDGSHWWQWNGSGWASGLPPPQLILDSVELHLDPDVDVDDDDEMFDDDYMPTHVVCDDGQPAWDAPDPGRQPVTRLDPLLDVQVTEQRADGWAHVRCENGWEAWVDGALLVPIDPL
jgi:hypothetical protein